MNHFKGDQWVQKRTNAYHGMLANNVNHEKLLTLWFHLEDTVLLFGTVLLFSPILFPKYEVWLLIGSIPLAKEAWLLYGLCCFTKMSYPTDFWALFFIWSMLNQNQRCDYYLDRYAKKIIGVLKVRNVRCNLHLKTFKPQHCQLGDLPLVSSTKLMFTKG